MATSLVEQRLDDTGRPIEDYAPIFDRAVMLNAKALIILMAVSFTPVLLLCFFKSKLPVGAHLVFSLHIYAFILILFCFSLLVAEINILSGGRGLASSGVDIVLSLINLAACAAYIYVAIGKTYGTTGAQRIAKALALAIAVAAIVIGYRFSMFVITLYST